MALFCAYLMVNAIFRMFEYDPAEMLLASIGIGMLVVALQIAALFNLSRSHEQHLEGALDAERRSAERSGSILQSVVETMPGGIFLVGDDRRIRLLNRRAALHFGLTRDLSNASVEALWTRVRGQLDPLDRRALSSLIEHIEQEPDHVVEQLELVLNQPAGETRLVLQSSPVMQDDTRLGRLWISRDVTKERRLTEDLDRARRLESLGGLAGGVAHDFNNHLTTILGNTEQVLDTLDPAGECARDLVGVRKSAEYCAELTRGLLDFARLSVSRPRPTCAREALELTARTLRPRLPEGVDIHVDSDPATPAIVADPTQLQRVLLNLVGNAVEAVGSTGRIEMAARPMPAGNGASGESTVEIVIADDGDGMDADVQDRIFDPFFTTKEHGTGLGLAIVYGIVESHRGSIMVDSLPGRGTVFRLTWPATAQQPTAEVESGDDIETPASHMGLTVLLAEDEPGVRELTSRLLTRWGYNVRTAEDGEQALAVFEEIYDQVDFALLDVMMPNRNGIAVMEAMRTRRPRLPIVLISGYATGATFNDLPSDVQFLPKPFRAKRLKQVLTEALAESTQLRAG